jgi:hypothetical protein
MGEGTTSRVMAVDRIYGEFYDFYSDSPVYFRYTLVCAVVWIGWQRILTGKTGSEIHSRAVGLISCS